MSGLDATEMKPGATFVIACAYAEGMLASSWFRAYKRVKQMMKRGSLDARVELLPMTDLPPHIDLLIVPPSLADAANSAPGIGECLVTSPERMQQDFDRILQRLVTDGRLEHALAPARVFAIHRGFQALAERARLAD